MGYLSSVEYRQSNAIKLGSIFALKPLSVATIMVFYLNGILTNYLNGGAIKELIFKQAIGQAPICLIKKDTGLRHTNTHLKIVKSINTAYTALKRDKH